MADQPPSRTSLTLLHRLRADEPEAWGQLVQLYGPLVRAWCGRLGARGADAEDVEQEVFRAAVAGLPGFRRDRPGDSFRGWLYGITRNMALKQRERAARAPGGVGGTDAMLRLQGVPEPSEPPEEGHEGDRAALLRRALELARGAFEENTWRAFHMTVIEDRMPEDVAAILGITPAAVRKYKSRVLHRIKEEYGELLD
jgi:RNA polymerase sigma-70 factor (ECF subfamily)